MQAAFDDLASLSRMDSDYEPYLEASFAEVGEQLLPLLDRPGIERIVARIKRRELLDPELEFSRAFDIINRHGPVGRRVVKKAMWLITLRA